LHQGGAGFTAGFSIGCFHSEMRMKHSTIAIFEYSQCLPRESAAEWSVCSVLWRYVTSLFSLHLQENSYLLTVIGNEPLIW